MTTTPAFLQGLNPPQLEAVTLPHQSALILAGAGSGKTRVLTTRIAWLISTQQVSPMGILAVTFTNKAAREMMTRLSAMLPINTRGMWVGTFHGLCNRFLRAHHREAALPQTFQILDTQDQLALTKRVMKAMNVDEEKYPPRQVAWYVSDQKENGRRAADAEGWDPFTRKAKEIYAVYEAQCQREGVADFSELLLRAYEVLVRDEPLREHYRNRFRHILVDEFQDTNALQYKWLKLLAGTHAGGSNAMFGVGDDDQCLAAGTLVTMADGSRRAIEKVRAGDRVRSCFGSGDFRAADVAQVFRKAGRHALVTLHTRSGARLTSTPEHTHFAGYILGSAPQKYFTYLMFKREIGYRVGTSRVYTNGQARPMLGYRQRAVQEHADALWVLGAHATENEARADEILLSLRYGLPTLPFTPRKSKSVNGLVHDAALIGRIYREIDTESAARRLLEDRGFLHAEPHHQPRARNANRRNVVLTLCGDRRGASPMHRISLMGNDAAGRRELGRMGLSVRPAKRGSTGWRFETCRKNFGEVAALADRIARRMDAQLVLRANLAGKSLPFVRARSVQPGMTVALGDGTYDVVDRVEHHAASRTTVFDLNVFPTHNFIASGVVTHNSIYSFRGATTANMQAFQRDFAVEKVIKLEQNYRSHGNILAAANALIGNNQNRLGKNLWTAETDGEKLRIYEAGTDLEEAAFIVDEAKTLKSDGAKLSDMAVLYRSNAQSRVIEHALFSAGVPYRVYGGLRFFERQEIKHALAYLRLLASDEDDGAFLRVVNFPTRGIGARTLEQVQDLAGATGMPLWQAAKARAEGGKNRDEGGGMRDEGKNPSSLIPHPSALKGVPAFIALLESMRAATQNLPLPEVIEHVIEHSGLKAHYQTEKEGQDRLENLNELVNAAAGFAGDEFREDASLAAFLAHAALEAGDNQANAGDDALQLMTVHSAKGLEFHAVFISGLEEGLFPHENSLNESDGLEEERRLMYVALTRARKRLYLSYTQSRMLHGQIRYNVASRFLEELPAALVKQINVAPRRLAALQSSPAYPAYPTAYPPVRAQPSPEFLLPAAMKQKDAGGFRIGQNVTHAKFGSGVIVAAEGRGADARVQVNFRDAGVKWLALEYAKLTAA